MIPEARLGVRCARAGGGALAAAVAATVRREPTASRAADLVRDVLVRLGPVPVKFGQVLATRADLLPAGWRTSLGALHDDVPPPPAGALLSVEGLGLAEAATERVLGSGSVAVVHAGVVDGRPVAVKRRRPGVEVDLETDLAVLVRAASLLARARPLRRLPVREVTEQVCGIIRSQVDLEQEAANLAALAEFTVGRRVHVPVALPEASTAEVLVTPLVTGLDRDAWTHLPEAERAVLVEELMHFVYAALFAHGLVHGDLHPGNVYADLGADEPRVVVLDGGMVFRLGEAARRSFMAFFLSFATGDGTTCAAVVWEAAEQRGAADRADFDDDMVRLIAHHHGRSARDFSLALFARDFFGLLRRHGLRASPDFALPVVALLVVEGTVREHAPDLDFQQLAVPHLLRATFALAPDDHHGDAIWRSSPDALVERA